jgi:hypothetical protein
METLEVIPDPVSLIESMRAFGYTVEAALADLIGRCSGRSRRPGVRPWCAFEHAGSVGGRVKSHRGRTPLRLQCDLMPKAPPKTRTTRSMGIVIQTKIGPRMRDEVA